MMYLGSVDEPHVERVIGMIYDVIQKFPTYYRLQHTIDLGERNFAGVF